MEKRTLAAHTIRETNAKGNAMQDFKIPPAKQFFSLGRLCQMFQRRPAEIHLLMRAANVEFVQSVDDVPYIDGNGLIRLDEVEREIRRGVQSFEGQQ